MTEGPAGERFAGMEVEEAREAVVAELKAEERISSIDPLHARRFRTRTARAGGSSR